MPPETLEQSGEGDADTDALIARQQYELEALRARENFQRQSVEDSLGQEEEKKKNKPMGWLFFLIALFLCLLGDIVDVLTGGTIGWLVGLVIDFILAVMFGLSKSGRKQFKRILVAILGESFPIIDVLPLRTVFLIWSFIKSRSEVAQKLESVAHKTL